MLDRNDYLERALSRYESNADADVIDAEIVSDPPEDAVPALEAVRDFFSGQL